MDKYGLIGFPLKHSFSIGYFNEKFRSEKIDAQYINFEIPSVSDIKEILRANPNLKGFNVTIPYKEQIIPYLNEVSEGAKAIGAVNVVKVVREKGKVILKGYNSDIYGFKESIEPLLTPDHQRALILGTGGSAKAIKYALDQLGVGSTFVSRTGSGAVLAYEDLTPEVMQAHKVIVNCTPVGMWPNVLACPKIPYDLLDSSYLLYDLLYNPDETLFMERGKNRGAQVKNGLEMLLLQAFRTWEIWTDQV